MSKDDDNWLDIAIDRHTDDVVLARLDLRKNRSMSTYQKALRVANQRLKSVIWPEPRSVEDEVRDIVTGELEEFRDKLLKADGGSSTVKEVISTIDTHLSELNGTKPE